jgi:hypothetical protein
MKNLPPNCNWKITLLEQLAASCSNTLFAKDLKPESQVGIHLAIFVEPYLTFLLQGKKTIESRFSVNKHAPFERVRKDDILIIKKTSGPVCGLCKIAHVWYYRIDSSTWPEIERHAEALCMDGSAFWERKKAASFATLMQIEDVHRIQDFSIDKEDPRSWVVVRSTTPPNQGVLL